MKIALTGGTGFIGRNLLAKLKTLDIEVVSIQRSHSDPGQTYPRVWVDTGDFSEMRRFFEQERFDGVVHLASYFVGEHVPDDVGKLLSSNLNFPTLVLDASAATGVKWFLNTGTFWQHFNDSAYEPVNLYAATKQAFEDIGRFYDCAGKLKFLTLKISDTYGPGDERNKLPKLLKQLLNDGRTLDMSPGEQLLSILHVSDVVNGFIEAINALHANALTGPEKDFALASSEVISLKNFVQLFSEIGGKPLHINWGARPYRQREVMNPWSKFKVLPNWQPKIPLRDGVRSYLESSN